MFVWVNNETEMEFHGFENEGLNLEKEGRFEYGSFCGK